jgi:HEAT repeat protein
VGEAFQAHADAEGLRPQPIWSEVATSDDVHLRLLKVLSAGEGEAGAGDVGLKEAAVEMVRALRIRPLYGAVVKAGREPRLRELIRFCVVSIGWDAAPALAQALKHASPHVRALACDGIGVIGLRDRGPLVQALLADPVDDVRLAAVVALARLKHDGAVAAIVRLLIGTVEAIRVAAAEALADMDPESVTRALLADAPVHEQARIATLEIMEENPHALQRLFIEASLRHADAKVRRAAVAALARQPSLELVDALAPLLSDESFDVRREVVIVLGTSRSRKARQLLLDQIARDPSTRAFAVRSLGDLGDATVVPLLIAMFEREPAMGRLAIIEALAELKQHAAEPLLVRVLGDPDPEVRRTAVLALGRFATTVSLRHAVVAARDPEWQVRAAVVDLLSPEGDAAAVAALERLCLDPHPFVASLAKRRVDAAEAA